MSKGPGTLQRVALELALDPKKLMTPLHLATIAFGTKSPSNSEIVSARRALRRLVKQQKVIEYGVDRQTKRKLYGGQAAVLAHLRQIFADCHGSNG